MKKFNKTSKIIKK